MLEVDGLAVAFALRQSSSLLGAQAGLALQLQFQFLDFALPLLLHQLGAVGDELELIPLGSSQMPRRRGAFEPLLHFPLALLIEERSYLTGMIGAGHARGQTKGSLWRLGPLLLMLSLLGRSQRSCQESTQNHCTSLHLSPLDSTAVFLFRQSDAQAKN